MNIQPIEQQTDPAHKLLLNILSYLDGPSLYALSLVSKMWYIAVNNDLTWKHKAMALSTSYLQPKKEKFREFCQKRVNERDWLIKKAGEGSIRSIMALIANDPIWEIDYEPYNIYFKKWKEEKNHDKLYELVTRFLQTKQHARVKDNRCHRRLINALKIMGYFFERGIVVEKDVSIAADYYQQAGETALYFSGSVIDIMDRVYTEERTKIAEECFHKCANLGNVDGYHRLANMNAVSNPKMTVHFLLKAAKMGSAKAFADLGFHYHGGYGVDPNQKLSEMYYLKAGKLGFTRAYWELGKMFEFEDYQKTAKYYQKGAELGDGNCMCYLADLYLLGHGVPVDPGQAKILRKKGKATGCEASHETRLLLAGTCINNKPLILRQRFLKRIFSFVDPSSIQNIMFVCQDWFQTLYDESVWENMENSFRPTTSFYYGRKAHWYHECLKKLWVGSKLATSVGSMVNRVAEKTDWCWDFIHIQDAMKTLKKENNHPKLFHLCHRMTEASAQLNDHDERVMKLMGKAHRIMAKSYREDQNHSRAAENYHKADEYFLKATETERAASCRKLAKYHSEKSQEKAATEIAKDRVKQISGDPDQSFKIPIESIIISLITKSYVENGDYQPYDYFIQDWNERRKDAHLHNLIIRFLRDKSHTKPKDDRSHHRLLKSLMSMGRIFEEGVVVEKDHSVAIRYYLAAADVAESFDGENVFLYPDMYKNACTTRKKMCLEKINRLKASPSHDLS